MSKTNNHVFLRQLEFDRDLRFDRREGGDLILPAMLDSGCTVGNFFEKSMLEKMNPRPRRIPLHEPKKALSATNGEIVARDEVLLTYKIGNHTVEARFLVTEGDDVGLILGRDEIKKNPWLIRGDGSVAPVVPRNKDGEHYPCSKFR